MKSEQQIKDYIKEVKTYKDEYPKSRETIIKTLEWVLEESEPTGETKQLGLF